MIIVNPLTGKRLLTQIISGANPKLPSCQTLSGPANLTLMTTVLLRGFPSGILKTLDFFQ